MGLRRPRGGSRQASRGSSTAFHGADRRRRWSSSGAAPRRSMRVEFCATRRCGRETAAAVQDYSCAARAIDRDLWLTSAGSDDARGRRKLLERADVGRAGRAVADREARALWRARAAAGEAVAAVVSAQATGGDLELLGLQLTDGLPLETELFDLLHRPVPLVQIPVKCWRPPTVGVVTLS